MSGDGVENPNLLPLQSPKTESKTSVMQPLVEDFPKQYEKSQLSEKSNVITVYSTTENSNHKKRPFTESIITSKDGEDDIEKNEIHFDDSKKILNVHSEVEKTSVVSPKRSPKRTIKLKPIDKTLFEKPKISINEPEMEKMKTEVKNVDNTHPNIENSLEKSESNYENEVKKSKGKVSASAATKYDQPNERHELRSVLEKRNSKEMESNGDSNFNNERMRIRKKLPFYVRMVIKQLRKEKLDERERRVEAVYFDENSKNGTTDNKNEMAVSDDPKINRLKTPEGSSKGFDEKNDKKFHTMFDVHEKLQKARAKHTRRSMIRVGLLYQGKSTFFNLDIQNCARKVAIDIVDRKEFDLFILLCIVFNSVMLALDNPATQNSDSTNKFFQISEMITLAIFTVEMCLKILAMGFIRNGKHSYLRDTWNILDFIVVVSGYLSIFSVMDGGASAIRSLRLLRPLRTLSKNENMKVLVAALLKSLPQMGDVLALVAFMFFTFALVGLQLFSGNFHRRCYDVGSETLTNVDHLCGAPAFQCPANSTCLSNSENPTKVISFDNILLSLLTVLQCISLEGWVDVMYYAFETTSYLSSVYFILLVLLGSMFVMELFVAVLFQSYSVSKDDVEKERLEFLALTNAAQLTQKGLPAVFPDELDAEDEKKNPNTKNNVQPVLGFVPSESKQRENKRKSLKKLISLQRKTLEKSEKFDLSVASPVIKVEGKNVIEENETKENRVIAVQDNKSQLGNEVNPLNSKNRLWNRFKNVNKTNNVTNENPESENAVISFSAVTNFNEKSVGNLDEDAKTKMTERERLGWKYQFYELSVNEKFDKIMLGIIAFNTLLMISEHHNQSDEWELLLLIFNFLFTFIFTAELVMKLIGLGYNGYVEDAFNRLDGSLVILNLIGIVLWLTMGMNNAAGAFRSFRLLRLFKMAKHWKDLDKLLRTVLRSIKGVWSLSLILLLFIFVYGVLGMQNFAGKLKDPDDPSVAPRSNFDSFGWSLVTVFQVMGGENWNEVLLYTVNDTGWMSILFVVSLFVFGNYLMLNLFVAILLSNFDNDDEEEEEEEEEDNDADNDDNEDKKVIEVQQNDQKQIEMTSLEKKNEVSKEIIEEKGLQKSNIDANEVEDSKAGLFAQLKLDYTEQSGLFDSIPKDIKSNSLFCFPPSETRLKVFELVSNPYFNNFILFVIIVGTIALAFDNPNDEAKSVGEMSQLQLTLFIIDILSTIIFSIEATLRIFASGFLLHPHAYLRNAWNVLDFFVVIVSIISLVLGSSASYLKAFKAMRALRPLRLARRIPSMRVVVESIVSALPSILNVMMISSLFYLIFGAVGIQLFKGTFYQCEKTSSGEIDVLFNVNKTHCEYMQSNNNISSTNYNWKNPDFGSFDNIFSSILLLFEIASMEMWPSIMYRAVDVTEVDQGPIRDNNHIYALYFVIFLIVANFFLINLILGVVVDSFNEMQEKVTGMGFLTQRQKMWLGIRKLFLVARVKADPELPKDAEPWRETIFHWVSSSKFEIIIVIAIISNVFALALEYDGQSENFEMVLLVINWFFSFVFLFEALMKMAAFGIVQYFSYGWNQFDFSLVLVSLFDILMYFATGSGSAFDLKLLRLLRVPRILRLFKHLEGLKKLVSTLINSLPALGNIFVLLLLIFFIYAIIGVSLFGGIPFGDFITIHNNFDNSPMAMLILFRMATGESWNGIMHEIQIQTKGTDKMAYYMTVPYFISFQLTGTYMMLNLLVAVIMQHFEDVADPATTQQQQIEDNESGENKETCEDGEEKFKKIEKEPLKLDDLQLFSKLWDRSCNHRKWWKVWEEDESQWLKLDKFALLLINLPSPMGLKNGFKKKLTENMVKKWIDLLDLPVYFRIIQYIPEVHINDHDNSEKKEENSSGKPAVTFSDLKVKKMPVFFIHYFETLTTLAYHGFRYQTNLNYRRKVREQVLEPSSSSASAAGGSSNSTEVKEPVSKVFTFRTNSLSKPSRENTNQSNLSHSSTNPNPFLLSSPKSPRRPSTPIHEKDEIDDIPSGVLMHQDVNNALARRFSHLKKVAQVTVLSSESMEGGLDILGNENYKGSDDEGKQKIGRKLFRNPQHETDSTFEDLDFKTSATLAKNIVSDSTKSIKPENIVSKGPFCRCEYPVGAIIAQMKIDGL